MKKYIENIKMLITKNSKVVISIVAMITIIAIVILMSDNSPDVIITTSFHKATDMFITAMIGIAICLSVITIAFMIFIGNRSLNRKRKKIRNKANEQEDVELIAEL